MSGLPPARRWAAPFARAIRPSVPSTTIASPARSRMDRVSSALSIRAAVRFCSERSVITMQNPAASPDAYGLTER
jgi:hypothetical protein